MTFSKKKFPDKANTVYKKARAHSYTDDSFSVKVIAPETILPQMTSTMLKLYTFALRVFTDAVYQDADDASIEKARHLHIYVDDYMKACGLGNEQASIRQMRDSITELSSVGLEWTEMEKKRDKKGKEIPQRYVDADGKKHKRSILEEHSYMGSFFGKVEIVPDKPFFPAIFKDTDGRKFFKVSINRDFANGLAHSPVMPYFDDLSKIDTNKFPSTMPIAHRMLQHSNMNRGKRNQYIISTKKLIAAAALPKPDKHWRRDVMESLERSLDEIQRAGMFLTWEYCNARRTKIPKGDFDEYSQFASAYVTWAPK